MNHVESRFPDTYANIETEQLLEVFSACPTRVSASIDKLKPGDLQAQPRPGKWSIQQIVLHLADSEIVAAARIRQTFCEPGAQFVVYDQDRWAEAFAYQKADPKVFYSSIMLFEAIRLSNTKIFRRAHAEDWQKYGIHPEWGKLTLRNLLELYADHGERHIAQILENRKRLKKPTELPLLLEKRLF